MIDQNMQKKAIKEIIGSPLRKMLSKLSNSPEDPKEQDGKKRVHRKIITQVPLVIDQTPRFVKCVSHNVENGNIKEYTWDKEKIFVHECLNDDILMLQNVFEGKIISSLIYPLVFDSKSPQKEVSLRSIEFYKEVQEDNSLYHNLSSDDKGYFLIGTRDLFIAACRGILNQDEKEILVNIVNLIDPKDGNIVYKTINNIDIAPYPTATHKMVRFIEEEKKFEEEDNNILDEYFVRNELGLLIGFVDPRDLSFHNLENIINLDSLFKVEEDFPITNFEKYGDSEVYTFDLEDSRNLLLSLDKCGLYTQPINKLSRGGERFIFASRVLGNNLTSAFQNYVSNETINNDSFQFVNYVFRYNKFKPGDRKFTSHFDTPYHDPARRHYSKYTLLLYLTSGNADPVLSIDNGEVRIKNIAANNGCVKGAIFDQKYEHEGKSFIDSDKIFLRSELVYSYSDEELSFNPDISKKFNIACYMTKQSVFNPELERYASDCFNQVAQARIDLANTKLTEDVLLYKNYSGVSFITNGFDYWFLKNTNLKRAAIVTILDYFGANYAGFDMKDYGPGVVCSIEDVKDVFKHLKKHACPNKGEVLEVLPSEIQKQENITIDEKEEEEDDDDDDLVESLKSEDDLDIYAPNMREIRGYSSEEDEDEYESESGGEDENEDKYWSEEKSPKKVKWSENFDNPHRCDYCDDHHPTSEEIIEYLEKKNQYSPFSDRKDEFAIFIFNKEIKIEKSKIRINPDSIIFEEKIPPVNFASCQYDVGESESHIFEKKMSYLTGYANIPPIPYAVHPEGYHLKIELFNNGFVREEDFKMKRVSLKEKYIQTEPREKPRETEIIVYLPEGQKLISDYFKPK